MWGSTGQVCPTTQCAGHQYACIDPINVAQHTAHKDPNSLRHYMTANLDTQQMMGRVLAQPDLIAEGLVNAHIQI